MAGLFDIFASAILPIIVVAGVGFLLGRFRDVDPGALNTVTVYVLAPALVFHSLATTTLSGGELVRVTLGVAAFHLLMLAIAEGVGRLSGETESLLSVLVRMGNDRVSGRASATTEFGLAITQLHPTVTISCGYTSNSPRPHSQISS